MAAPRTNKLIEENYHYVLAVVLRLTQDRQAAEDALHDAAINVISRIDQLKDEKKFRSWFTAAAINAAKNNFKRNRLNAAEDLDVHAFELSTESTAIDDCDDRARVEGLAHRIARLPPRQHQAFMLRAVSGLAFKDVAEIMNCPYHTAKANFRHAQNKLRS